MARSFRASLQLQDKPKTIKACQPAGKRKNKYFNCCIIQKLGINLFYQKTLSLIQTLSKLCSSRIIFSMASGNYPAVVDINNLLTGNT